MWSSKRFFHVYDYKPPVWASKLKVAPAKRVKLAMLPTPITPWRILNAPSDLQLYIKRDDMTGNGMSGNKVRKLEFLLADAISKGCKSVITCGGIQSNHCRATAIAARELGLDCHLFLRADQTDLSVLECPGNLLLDLLVGSKVHFVSKKAKYETEIRPMQEELVENLLKSCHEKSYCIPIGGSNSIGLYGYIEAWQEMVEQNLCYDFDDVVVTCGSGGSVAGLSVANYLTGQKVKLHAISVCDDNRYFHGHVNEMLAQLGITDVKSEEIVDIIDGYKGEGYGLTTEKDLKMINEISSTTGIFCDPVYTGKGIKGLLAEFEANQKRFKGNRVLFIHTGGIFSLYDGKMKKQAYKCFKSQVVE